MRNNELQGLSGHAVGEVEAEVDGEKLVHDSSVDHRGRPPLRAATGSWKAAMFIIASEFAERLSFFGIATTLMVYLTTVLHKDMTVAAQNTQSWLSFTTLMPLLGGFLADAYVGRFASVVLSTAVYITGLVLLATAQLAPGLSTTVAPKIHETIFFVGMYLVSIGTGGHKPSLESFGADQFDDGHAGERLQKMSFFNWWNAALCSGVLLGVTVVAYVQQRVGWGAATVLVAGVMAVSLALFITGRRTYRYRKPGGSPLTPLLRVGVAAARKRQLELPANKADLYEVAGAARLLSHTPRLQFLDKAAILEPGGERGPWWLATVTEVEETKLLLSTLPVWLAAVPFGIMAAQVTSFFVKQAGAMDRRLGAHLVLPPATVFAAGAVAMIATVAVHDKLLEPCLRRATGAQRGISVLRRIGVGMALAAVAMAVAAIVERHRLHSAVTISVLWLLPQFAIMGIADAFALVALQEFFYCQVPETMRSLGIGFYLSVAGVGSLMSSVIIGAASHITSGGGRHEGWFGKDLSDSRLDLFYWLLATIGTMNLGFYILVARRYPYKQNY
ncbi:protein NRT1/ PTR FAMILY 5.7-like [Lolium rigidum]|uniref:protein NRT1/ PTR FAMILY 5.7-like n=1 Tax=Lolium rigidum TaxID=89674 RepID=UPI001F5DA626|nr:protein NRT1/ PTR FAMILY 5.7-like [Lolium rigidum]